MKLSLPHASLDFNDEACLCSDWFVLCALGMESTHAWYYISKLLFILEIVKRFLNEIKGKIKKAKQDKYLFIKGQSLLKHFYENVVIIDQSF